jgi:hypothetical protein
MIRFNLVMASFLLDMVFIVIWTTLSDNKISQCQKKTSIKIVSFKSSKCGILWNAMSGIPYRATGGSLWRATSSVVGIVWSATAGIV